MNITAYKNCEIKQPSLNLRFSAYSPESNPYAAPPSSNKPKKKMDRTTKSMIIGAIAISIAFSLPEIGRVSKHVYKAVTNYFSPAQKAPAPKLINPKFKLLNQKDRPIKLLASTKPTKKTVS